MGNNTLKGSQVVINGVSISPQALTMTISDVDFDSGRDATGKMVRNMVGTKRSYAVTMPPCHTSVIKPVLKAMEGKQFFQCSFPDPLSDTGQYRGTFYVGDRSMPIYNYDLDIWNTITFDLVEQ